MSALINRPAPDFVLPSTGGKNFKLQDRYGKLTVLFFFPKDFTPGCTAEACKFRDEINVFRDSKVDVFGISKDSLATHLSFKDRYRLPFELLSDENGGVAKQYDAYIPVIGAVKRVSYLIDENLIIRFKYSNLFNAASHINQLIGQVSH